MITDKSKRCFGTVATWRCLLALLPMLFYCQPGMAAAPLSVQQWISQKDQWSKLEKSGETIRIEGRISSVIKSQVRLHKCHLAFRSESGKSYKKLSGHDLNVQMSGYLKTRKGKLEFVITHIRITPSDMEEFISRSNKLTKGTPQQWFNLATWAENRATFYGDELLQEKGTEAWIAGVKTERKLIKQENAKGLLQLAEKLSKQKLAPRLQMEYQHAGYRTLWKESQKKTEHNHSGFLTLLIKHFPKCKTPLVEPDKKLHMAYVATPIKIYQSSDDTTRNKLHRLFYREVLLPTLLANAKENPRLGYEVAESLIQQIPEEAALAKQLQDKELAFRMEHFQTATRSQLLNLKKKYLGRKQPQQAEFVVQKWLAAREILLRKEGPTGLVRSAQEYIELKNDKAKGAKLLLEAFKKNAETPGVTKELKKLGYHYHQKKWLNKEEYKNRKIDPIEYAMKNGYPIKGMTPTQVIKARGKPTSKCRMISSNAVIVIWVYGKSDKSHLTVHFRYSSSKNSSAIVVKVKYIQPR